MIRKSFVLTTWCVPVFAFHVALATSNAKDVPITSAPSVTVYSLIESELQFHKARALIGDPISGYCLAMHFAFVDIRNPDVEYWITIAAENGDSASMKMLSLRLAARQNVRDLSRAKFWQERAEKAATPMPTQAQCHGTTD